MWWQGGGKVVVSQNSLAHTMKIYKFIIFKDYIKLFSGHILGFGVYLKLIIKMEFVIRMGHENFDHQINNLESIKEG